MTIDYRFCPWIGKDYFSDGLHGKKIFILGESHYADTLTSNQFTINIIEKQINNQQTIKFFNKIERLLSDHEQTYQMNQTDREHFWNNVVFYNYIQEPFNKPREKVLPAHWENSLTIECFEKAIHTTNPDFLLVFGKRLSVNMKHPVDMNYKIISFMHPSSFFFRFKKIREKLHDLNFFNTNNNQVCPSNSHTHIQ